MEESAGSIEYNDTALLALTIQGESVQLQNHFDLTAWPSGSVFFLHRLYDK
jgi:hypothetical protein